MFDWVLNAPLKPVIINCYTPYLPVCLCYLHVSSSTTNVLPILNYKRATLPLGAMLEMRNKASQFANCESLLENCKSEVLKKIVKQLFLAIIIIIFFFFFFHFELFYLLCLLVEQARKWITQISYLIFHRIA